MSPWLKEITYFQSLLQPVSLVQFDVVVDFLGSELTHEVHVQLNDPGVNVHLFVCVYSATPRIPEYQVKETEMFILQLKHTCTHVLKRSKDYTYKCSKIMFLDWKNIEVWEKSNFKTKKPTYYLSCCVSDFLLVFIFESIAVYYRSIDSNVCVFIHCINQN